MSEGRCAERGQHPGITLGDGSIKKGYERRKGEENERIKMG